MSPSFRAPMLAASLVLLFSALFLLSCGGGGGGGTSIGGKTFGGAGKDVGRSVIQKADGGYLVAGFTNSSGAGGFDAYLVETDKNGGILREQTLGTSGADFAFSARQTTDGGYIVTGVYNAVSFPDVSGRWVPVDLSGRLFLRKTNATLGVVWEKQIQAVAIGNTSYDYAMGYEARQTADNGYIVVGATGTGGGGGQTFLVKTDSDGTTQWSALLDGELGTGVRQAADGGFVVSSTGVAGDNWLTKIDADGTQEWELNLGTAEPQGVCVATGGYAVTGDLAGDVYLAKVDISGDLVWDTTFGSAGGDRGFSVEETADQGFIIAGEGSGAEANHLFDAYLAKTDSGGALLWENFFGKLEDEVARSVQLTADGGFILAGSTVSYGAGLSDVYLIKTDSAGTAKW